MAEIKKCSNCDNQGNPAKCKAHKYIYARQAAKIDGFCDAWYPKTEKRGKNPIDTKMYKKGYRYKLMPTNDTFPPLYAKSLKDVSLWKKEYDKTIFEVTSIN